MAVVRPLEKRDLPELARLFGQVYPDAHWSSPAECAAYFHDIFFRNPWVDPAFPSWVACDAAPARGGRIVGFIGVMPRTMRHEGRPVRTAVLSQLMVEPEKRHGLAAAQLLRKALAGPQELTISDGANESSRSMWEALGGFTSTLYSLQWRRLLRPAQYGLERAAGRSGGVAARLAAPIAALADAYAAHRKPLRPAAGIEEQPLDTAALLAALRSPRVALRPQYDLQSLEWLLAQARAKRRHGELQARLLRRSDGQVAGWFLYYLNPGTSKVLQLEAREEDQHAVLEQLFHHAWRRGARAIEGRMEPRLVRALSSRHCFFHAPGAYALFQAHDPALLATLGRGDAFFSRLEGEWWTRFAGEPHRAKAPRGAASQLVARLRAQPVGP